MSTPSQVGHGSSPALPGASANPTTAQPPCNTSTSMTSPPTARATAPATAEDRRTSTIGTPTVAPFDGGPPTCSGIPDADNPTSPGTPTPTDTATSTSSTTTPEPAGSGTSAPASPPALDPNMTTQFQSAPPSGPQGPRPAATPPSQPETGARTFTDPLALHHAKRPLPPALDQRQNRSSLLTQALATARGIPAQAQPPAQPSTASSSTTSSSSSTYTGPGPRTTNGIGATDRILPEGGSRHPYYPANRTTTPYRRDTAFGQPPFPDFKNDGSRSDDVAGRSLTPKAAAPSASAPLATPTDPTTATHPESTPPSSSLTMHSMGGATGLAMGPQPHIFPSDRSSDQNPLERLEWEIRALERQRTSRIYSHPLNSENLSVITALDSTDKASTPVAPAPDSAEDEERRARSDAKRRENRYSIGPEKMWSIGSGEMGDVQDGHVEKSIAKAMTRAEPNNRSRKSSHTLGFFREGLPEEKAKRKDSKGASQARVGGVAQPPGRVGSVSDIIFEEPVESPESEKSLLHSPRKEMPQVASRRPTLVLDTPIQPSEFDEEAIPSGGNTREEATGVALPPPSPATSNDELPRDAVDESPKERPSSTDSTKVGTHHDEGDDSGEEKISSAFFLPHQDPERVDDERCGISEEGELVSGRSQLRTQDRNRWLVKAGEPEPEDHTPPPTPPSSQSGRGAPHPFSIPAGPSTAMTCGKIAIVAEPEETLPSSEKTVSHPTLMYNDNYSAQEHHGQEAARRPLEAIELIPYKHQVGGHTPLWRFSKRAVCKKLNNRENEFYETVEHLHRDLLSFLPRYIGVLNVAFQKSPRRKSTAVKGDLGAENGAPSHLEGADERADQLRQEDSGPRRIISQSFSSGPVQVPTVTFDDNRHIIPRNLLQPDLPPAPPVYRRARTVSGSTLGTNEDSAAWDQKRPSLADTRIKSWGATIVNKRLRNEVFNNAFYEQPVDIQPHRKPHRRPLVPRPAIPHQPALKSAYSDSGILNLDHPSAGQPVDSALGMPAAIQVPSQARLSDKPSHLLLDALDLRNTTEVKDVTGTSAPEPETIGESFLSQKRKRRYSGSGLRRKPQVGSEFRGDLKYYEEADQVTFPGDERHSTLVINDKDRNTEPALLRDEPLVMMPGHAATVDNTVAPPPPVDFKIPRPVNPKEAQTKRDSRVEFFLLLEDLTAGMKRPCIMDLKMGTRQYGVDATPAKQLSQKGKCAKTTSLELGVRVCGLQVWDVATQSYIFRDKYEGRKIKAGAEFQEALTRFLYNGVDYHSVLRQIPTIIRKLDELTRIAKGLKGYRFYAASLLMFYDGEDADGGDAVVDDSTTDAATDAEDASVHRRRKRNKREVDFKIADFANSITATSDVADKACPPRYPNEPDRGFLRGLASLRRYFLKIQRDVRAEMGIEPSRTRYEEVEEEDGFVSE